MKRKTIGWHDLEKMVFNSGQKPSYSLISLTDFKKIDATVYLDVCYTWVTEDIHVIFTCFLQKIDVIIRAVPLQFAKFCCKIYQ